MIIQSKYGTKYTCFSCGCKFYDLNKEVALCPRCNADQKDRPKDAEEEEFDFEEQRDEELAIIDDDKTEDEYDKDEYLSTDSDEEESPETERRVPTDIEFYDDEGDGGFNKQ